MAIPDFGKTTIFALVDASKQVVLEAAKIIDLDIFGTALWANTSVIHELRM